MVKRENVDAAAVTPMAVPPNEVRYRGVSKRSTGKYSAKITEPIHQRQVWLGTFNTPEQAAKAYDKAARLYRGPKVKTNFPAMNEDNVENLNPKADTDDDNNNNNNPNQSSDSAPPPLTALEEFYLEVMRRGGLIPPDPTGDDSQDQSPTTKAEPLQFDELNLDLTLAPPGM